MVFCTTENEGLDSDLLLEVPISTRLLSLEDYFTIFK